MIRVLTAQERRHHRRQHSAVVDERRLRPGAELLPRGKRQGEIITYVREGALRCEVALGRSEVIHAGEFQRMTVGGELPQQAMNAAHTGPAQVFELWLGPATTALASDKSRRFSSAERRGGLCMIASSDGRKGSLRIHHEVVVCSALLAPGQHVVHELAQGRSVWLQIIRGEVACDDLVLHAGDGARFSGEHAVSLTARLDCELLLIDFPPGIPQ